MEIDIDKELEGLADYLCCNEGELKREVKLLIKKLEITKCTKELKKYKKNTINT